MAAEQSASVEKPSKTWLFISCFAGAALGCVLVVAPAALSGKSFHSVFELIDYAVKSMSVSQLGWLVAGGFFWGLIWKWPQAVFAAACQPASLFAFAIIDMVRDPTSHNLWPFEFLIYLVLGLVCVAGAAVALFIKRTFKNTR